MRKLQLVQPLPRHGRRGGGRQVASDENGEATGDLGRPHSELPLGVLPRAASPAGVVVRVWGEVVKRQVSGSTPELLIQKV